jgi:DNA-binding transcriptional MerR regulator
MNDEDLLSPKNAAAFLAVSTKWLRQWEAIGVITPLRLPSGQRRYRVKELQKLLKVKGSK